MRYLSDILEGLAFTELHGSADMEISAIVFDSRKVIPGSLFVAVRGTQVDGHDYIDQAVSRGAVAVICEDLPAHVTGEVDFFIPFFPHLVTEILQFRDDICGEIVIGLGIKTHFIGERDVFIGDGLHAGEQVVMQGVHTVTAGEKVTPIAPPHPEDAP